MIYYGLFWKSISSYGAAYPFIVLDKPKSSRAVAIAFRQESARPDYRNDPRLLNRLKQDTKLNWMILAKFSFLLAFVLPAQLLAQTITAKVQINPFHDPESIPLSLGAGVEVGLSPKSALQLGGLYRLDHTGYGVTKGPKFYLDYRYYVKPQKQRNSGFYLSPFVGFGHQQLGSDDFDGLIREHTLTEQLAGFVVGYQPYQKSSRFTVDLYAGPEYQWRVERYNFYDFAKLFPYQVNRNRMWFRAGITFCLRVKR